MHERGGQGGEIREKVRMVEKDIEEVGVVRCERHWVG